VKPRFQSFAFKFNLYRYTKAESVLMEGRHKSEMATKAARDRIGGAVQAVNSVYP
jgi:hypothetical protein